MVDIVCDYETRSRVSLRDTNVYKYARHSSTEALCMSYSINGGPIRLWVKGDPFPFEGYWPNCRIVAFNAEFEFAIWNYVCTRPEYDWPELPASQMDCLQARSAYAGWPRQLAAVSKVIGLGVSHGKDTAAHKNLLRLCKPVRGKLVGCEYMGGKFDDCPNRHERHRQYCKQDTKAECMVHRCAPPLPDAERVLWRVHQRINERGVPVDVDFCRNAVALVEREKKRLCHEIEDQTAFLVRTPNCVKAMLPWLRKRGYPYWSLTDECVSQALYNSKLSDEVRGVLQTRKLYHDAAVTKYQAILNHVEADGFCRAAHVFYKAGPGRFAGAGVNFLNLRRMNENDVERLHNLADRISASSEDSLDGLYHELRESGGVIPTLGSMVRAAVRAQPGYKLVDMDFRGIEYRKLHWLADDKAELARIRDFDGGKGADPYKLAAAEIYRKKVEDVDKAERQTGKVMILGCGYLSGAQTFAAFCANYGIDMPLDRAQELVQTYRRMYPLVKKFWYDAGRCAVKAVDTGQPITLRNMTFFRQGNTLNIKLPSGRLMKYYDVTVVDSAYGPQIAALDQRTGGVKEVGLPILIENIDQGSSRDVLADSLIRGDAAELPVCLHVYDSIMLHVPEDDAESEKTLASVMTATPEWAAGLPLAVDKKITRRMT